MKHTFLTSLIALATVGASFAQETSPTPTPAAAPTVQEQIKQLQDQLALAKLKSEIAALQNPTPSPTPAPAIVNNINVVEKNNSDNVTQQQQVVTTPIVTPVVVQAAVPNRDLAPGQMPSSNEYLNWTFRVWEALSKHDSEFVTRFTDDGHVNYFGHTHTYDNYIVADMSNDARRYIRYHNNYDLNSFQHDVSNEYSAKWQGPMIYDSITVFAENWEVNGTYHRATIRFTVGYTLPNNRVYALVMKVL